MRLNLPKETQEIFEKFKAAGYKIYLVGGCVRDLLMGRKTKDFDFTTSAKPEEILKLYPQGFYNNDFGTVGVVVNNRLFEITTMRKESGYEDSRHPSSIEWTDKIEEDLGRRDFTVNAIAAFEEEIVDPFDGQRDITQKQIKAVGAPDSRFQEDALRLLRAIRFATQLEFNIEEQTFESIKKNALKIKEISWERIRDELFKILESDFPYEGLMMLRSSGLLEIVLPEIESCFGIMQEGPKHDRVYDIGEHSFKSLKFCASPDPIVRFACLIHDIGKVPTHRIQKDGNVTFYGHDIEGGKIAGLICQRLRLSRKQTDKIVGLVKYHLFTVDEHQTDAAVRRFIKNVGKDNLEDMFVLREADRLGGASNPTSWRLDNFKERIKHVLTKPFSITDLKVNGSDVMRVLSIKPSRRVGEILEKLFIEVTEDKSKNEKDYLLKRIEHLNQ